MYNSSDEKINTKSMIGGLIKGLYSNNSIERQRTREVLVSIGQPVLAYLADLLTVSNLATRWEAVKAIGQIKDLQGIPLLLDALNDEEFEIRWLAAEGLIEMGKHSLVPLFEKLIDNYQSVFFRQGAHHVINELKTKGYYNDPNQLLSLLKDTKAESILPIEVKKELDRIRNIKHDS